MPFMVCRNDVIPTVECVLVLCDLLDVVVRQFCATGSDIWSVLSREIAVCVAVFFERFL